MNRATLRLGFLAVAIGCADRPADFARGGGDTDPTVASLTLDRAGGTFVHGSVSLVVPEGALSGPTTITLKEVEGPPHGAVGSAWEFGPDGLLFRIPATLTVAYDPGSLPPGIEASSLRLAVRDGPRWRALERPGREGAEEQVVGTVLHFSTYGIVPDPRETEGTGTRWEANGVVAETSTDAWGRLYVSPAAISMFVQADAAGPMTLTLSGLPTDEANHLYVDGYGTHVVVAPSAGGVATVELDSARPHFLWVQPGPGTTFLGGAGDQCHLVGVRAGNTCTLTRDVVGAISIEAAGQELDCAGHRITQDPFKPESGIGVLVSAFQRPISNVAIRNCRIGAPGLGFFQAVDVVGAPGVEIADSVFEDNMLGIYLQAANGARLLGNRFEGAGNYAIQVYEGSTDGVISDNRVEFAGGIEPGAIVLKGGKPGSSTNFTSRISVRDNRIVGGTLGIGLVAAKDNELTGNEIDGAARALWLGPDGWPNRVWWNNIHGSAEWAVWADFGPAELSDAGRGNWWGHGCPGPLFWPGIDSSTLNVRDSHAYGGRDEWAAGGGPGCTGDHDGDTMPDASDNCPDVPNPGQEDGDGIGEGDACDATAPAPPIVSSPAQGVILTTSDVVVRGTAESGAMVRMFLDDTLFASAAAEVDGQFTSTFWALADGIHRLQADAADAAGNVSGTCDLVIFTVHTVPPSPPLILSPRPLELITTSQLAVEGAATAAAEVRLLVDGLAMTSVPVEDTRGWSAESVGPLTAGVHSLVAQSVDSWGLVSAPSEEIRILVQPVEGAAPVVGGRGKLRLVELRDDPDPFIAGVENVEFSLRAESDAVHALGGRSTRNHAFTLRAHWTVEDARTGAELRTINASGAVNPTHGRDDSVVSGEVVTVWDGRDSGGSLVPQARQLAVHVRVELVRSYIGHGTGSPCSRDEEVRTDVPGWPSCLVDSVELRMASTTMAIPAPSLPTASIRIERGWTLREAVAVRFLAQDRYGVVGVLRGSPATGGPEAHRVVFWVIEGDSTASASYGHVISDPAGVEIWRNLGSAAEPTRHEIRGLRAAPSQSGDGCAILAWRYEVNPPESCDDTPSGRRCVVERIGSGAICPDGTIAWPAGNADVTFGNRWDDPRIERVWIYGPAMAARNGEFVVAASAGSNAFWRVRRVGDGSNLGGIQNCWPDTVACDEGLPAGHPVPELPQLVWHPGMGRYLLGVVLRDPRISIGCVVGTRVETDGTPLGPCLEGESRRFHGAIALPDLPHEIFLSHAANPRNPAQNIVFASDHRVVWLDWTGSVLLDAANPQLDVGIRAVCEDWRIGAGSTVARAFRWTAGVMNPYDPWCTTPSAWARCLASIDSFHDPLATEELVYRATPAPAAHGRRFDWFLADDCASAGTFDDPEMMLIDPGYRGIVVYMVGY